MYNEITKKNIIERNTFKDGEQYMHRVLLNLKENQGKHCLIILEQYYTQGS